MVTDAVRERKRNLSEIVLNPQQDKVMQALKSGENVFITGSAGTGKSVLIREFIKDAESRNLNVVVVAPTGIAALNVNGSTAHRTFNIPLHPLVNDPPKQANEVLVACDVLIIEEISMFRLDTFDYVCKMINRANMVRASEGDNAIQIVVVGDFFQLPPVLRPTEKPVLDKHYGYDIGKAYAFQSKWWDTFNFKSFNLTQVMRQSDELFIRNLDALKVGKTSAIPFFKNYSSKVKTGKIELCGRNDVARTINMRELDKIPAEKHSFTATIKGNVSDSDKLTDDVIDLKVGARVVMLLNDSEGFYCNGSYGTVKSFLKHSGGVEIELDSGKVVVVTEHTWEIKRFILKNENGVKRVDVDVVGTFTQLPLRLAYAITIHKSQGQTYDTLSVNPYSWEPGQLYVALSRVRDIKGLYLDGYLSEKYVITSKSVLDFYQKLFG